MSQKPEPIAIVGAGGIFPDAPTPARFWENLVAGPRKAPPRTPPPRGHPPPPALPQ